MRKTSKISLALIASASAAVGGLATSASASSLVTNGGFESNTVTVTDPFTTVTGGTDIGGWTVTGDSVDIIGNYWQAAEGSHSVDLSGNAPGGVTQDIATIPGATYAVSFEMSGNPDQASLDPMSVSWGGSEVSSSPYVFDSSTASKLDMNWTPYSFTATAAGTSTTLAFASETSGPYGPVLDDVSVTQVSGVTGATYAGASQGVYTNKGTTVVQQVQVTSDDPNCIAGRTVWISLNGGTAQKAVTDLNGLASSKFSVTGWSPGTYPVTFSVEPSNGGLCQAASGSGNWVYKVTKN